MDGTQPISISIKLCKGIPYLGLVGPTSSFEKLCNALLLQRCSACFSDMMRVLLAARRFEPRRDGNVKTGLEP